MIVAVPIIVVAMPFATALLLAVIASWRIGVLVNAISATLQTLLACLLLWQSPTAGTLLAAVTAFVAMTTSWFGHRDIAAALAARSLSRRRARLYHVGYQVMIGAIQGAALAANPILTWIALVVAAAAAAAMTAAPRGPAAASATSGLVLHCSIGLVLALLGALLLDSAPGSAAVFLCAGYGALAGLVPLHAWWPDAAAEGFAPGAIILTLMANVPLLLFMRLRIEPGYLVGFGLASLLPAAVALFAHLDWRRTVALAGVAQLGMIVFAIGIGARQYVWPHMTLFALARAALWQTQGDDMLVWLVFALIPVYALYLLAGSTVAVSAWLLAPLAAGVLLVVWALIRRLPTTLCTDWRTAMPIWLQLAIMAMLAFGMPTANG